MPDFTYPFQGNIEPFNSDDELISALKLDLIAEMDAVQLYDAHIKATNDQDVIIILSSIRDEEKVHIGELYTLIGIVSGIDQWDIDIELNNKGVNEVYDLLEECIIMANNKNKLQESAKDIAEVIYEQLGGNKIYTMIGMYDKMYDADGSFSFKFKAKAKNKINYCKITLTGRDDYTMTFGRIHGYDYDVIEEIEGIYAEDLERIFGDVTGLATRL